MPTRLGKFTLGVCGGMKKYGLQRLRDSNAWSPESGIRENVYMAVGF